MPVAKGRRQIVIVDRPAALAGRTADWRETSFVGQTAALSYRVDRRQPLPNRVTSELLVILPQSAMSNGPSNFWVVSLRFISTSRRPTPSPGGKSRLA